MTTIRDLSDEDLSRWIVDGLEPLTQDKYGDAQPLITALEPQYWVWCDGIWQPRDMVNDAAMTVMLMERGLGSLDWVSDGTFKMWRGGFERQDHSRIEYITAKSLGRAVAEAFALANGWEAK